MADATVTAASVATTSTTLTRAVQWGGTITAGMAVYEDSSDNNDAKAADCTTSAATAACKGIALNGGADGQPGDIAVGGELDPGFTATEGVIYVLSEAGAICPSADLLTDDYVTIIGVGNASGNIDLIMKATGSQVQ